MTEKVEHFVLESTGAKAISHSELIQELWSSYGRILRVHLIEADHPSVVVKHVQWPTKQNHPRGWNSNFGHQRKLKSYQVESHWYQDYSKLSKARLPECYALKNDKDEVVFVLEDLKEAGFSLTKNRLTWSEFEACLAWLAKFHASYMGLKPDGLWENGSYWHLETRPDELAALDDQDLKAAAAMIDNKLNSAQYKCLLHGDAKLANFCFSPEGEVAGLDFQYVGGGCGMKDLAYFVGSVFYEEDCEKLERKILDRYFHYLQKALSRANPELEAEWRSLYHWAWADFHRFLKGWSPGHWKLNSYSERITREIIQSL